MIITSARVRNFRSFRDETLDCDRLTVLVGPNGSGKSSFLRALQIFYTPNASVSLEDFHGEDPRQPITVTVTFGELTDEEKDTFSSRLQGELLTVEKEIKWADDKPLQRYFGTALRHAGFQDIRDETGVASKRAKHRDLVNSGTYEGLDVGITAVAAMEQALGSWEAQHPDECERIREETQFFGFKEVGKARLEASTKFILIPAVREALTDATEGRGNPLFELMEVLVRSTLAQREDIAALRKETVSRYEQMVDPAKIAELQALEDELSNNLQLYAADSSVELEWEGPATIEMPLPKARVKLIENGFNTTVTGPGTDCSEHSFLPSCNAWRSSNRPWPSATNTPCRWFLPWC
ncbi:MAG: AAA family ATPase [Chloroflexi bacterium]|nr:AAA family ATPase [Chloroflexota bacterium]